MVFEFGVRLGRLRISKKENVSETLMWLLMLPYLQNGINGGSGEEHEEKMRRGGRGT